MVGKKTFSKNNRVLKSGDLYHYYKNGKRYNSGWLAISLSYGKTEKKLGIIIRKKTFKGAVHRNLFKRIAREWFRNFAGEGETIIICVEKKPEKIEKKYFLDKIAKTYENLKNE